MSSTLPLLDITSLRTLELCHSYPDNYNNLPSLFICSYPKSGTTWTQAIIFHLLVDDTDKLDHISNYSPFFEIDNTWDHDTNQINVKYQSNFRFLRYNVFNTHLLRDMMPNTNSPTNKFIYIMRHPFDVVVSFFHHLSNQAGGYNGTFQSFLQQWLDGSIIYGKWTNHLRSWIEHPSSNILVLKYEDMKANITKSIHEIAAFMDIHTTDEVVAGIVPKISFDGMKSDKNKYQPVSVTWKEGYDFLRKGVVGDGSSMIGVEDQRLVQQILLKEFDGEYPDWFPYKI